MTPSFRAYAVAVAVLSIAACSGGDVTNAVAKPASIESGSTSPFSATVGTALAVAPTFVVKDSKGNAIGNTDVSVVVSAGGGTLTGAPTRTSNGATSVGTWVLGSVAGTNTLTVTVAGLPAFSLTATGKPDVPASLSVVSGNGQRVPAGTAVPQQVAVRVADRFNNGVPGIVVNFSVQAGLGLLQGAPTATTDATGTATAPPWSLGKFNVPNQLVATTGNISAPVNATVATNYVVDLRFYGPSVDPGIAQAFSYAANRISAEITGGVLPVDLSGFDLAGQCGVTGFGLMTELVTSVVIFATVKPIDGVGKIIGQAGPCIIRATGKLTIIGVMEFDVADLQTIYNDGRLNDVILHEMHHVLGFGTVWDRLPANSATKLIINAGTSSSAFTGASALQGCLASGGGQGTCVPTIPLENSGGAGTADSHWRESIFRTELMTGFVSPAGVPNPLSQMTIGSMADLGYLVNPNVADSYSVPSAVAYLLDALRAAGGEGFTEVLMYPRYEVTRNGVVTKLPERR